MIFMKNKTLKVVIINGSGGAGKDTFVRFCKDFVEVESVSSVDIIKKAASTLGWSGGKQLQDRKFLSELKDLSTWYNDLPFRYLKRAYSCKAKRVEKGILFFHIREPKEIERAKKEFDAVTVLIKRKGLLTEYENHADDNVGKYKYDYVITNDGTLDDLSLKAEKFVFDVMWGK